MTSHDDLRIGDAERDAAVSALREHYARGRLTLEEFGERVDLVLAARTGGELARVGADLPGGYGGRGTGPEGGHEGLTEHAGHEGHGGHGDPGGIHPPRPAWRRHGRPPAFVFLPVMLVAGVAAAGFGVLRILLTVWLMMAVMGMVHRRRRRARAWEHRPPAAHPMTWGPHSGGRGGWGPGEGGAWPPRPWRHHAWGPHAWHRGRRPGRRRPF
ncbi:DUF1707 SHOCT-like domain-containing protein [Streptosporangium sandarakinum]|uniref:Putative membrane protein n=1 Tax=Streptosporangium sandarakinum TaxID=1260955 RepID=A0A852V7E5_9ACTN|nr:DUF1707 domain-containing protein [Streptosporangium sandarakinum]NYF43478.1 putative membrane protein [Streptosporangium sandarakinum]